MSGRLFSEIGLMFKDYADRGRLPERIAKAGDTFNRIADIEEEAFPSIA